MSKVIYLNNVINNKNKFDNSSDIFVDIVILKDHIDVLKSAIYNQLIYNSHCNEEDYSFVIYSTKIVIDQIIEDVKKDDNWGDIIPIPIHIYELYYLEKAINSELQILNNYSHKELKVLKDIYNVIEHYLLIYKNILDDFYRKNPSDKLLCIKAAWDKVI